MKIYKISYNINQNDILASKLSKEIFFVVQGNMRNNAYKEISVDNICKLHINTFNNTQGQLRYGTFDISASFDFAINDIYPPEMRVELRLSNQFSNQNFNELYNVLFEAIKHELGHYHQYRTNRENIEENDKNESNDTTGYCLKLKQNLLSNLELIPYIKGLVFQYKKLKKRSVSFESIIDQNLNGLIFRNNEEFKNQTMRSPEWAKISKIISEIKATIINKAKELYPFLRREP